jgi:hypothetical protein
MCPKCEQNKLCKIRFRASKKLAYLCTVCSSFWFVDEHIDSTTGHMLHEAADDQHSDDTFDYLDKNDKEYQENKDKKEREEYELL